MTGSAGQKRVPPEFIENFPIYIMSANARAKSGTLFTFFDREIAILEENLYKLRTGKLTVMRKLLNSEWRLDERFDL
jgi:type I restriction enzyme, S subunit